MLKTLFSKALKSLTPGTTTFRGNRYFFLNGAGGYKFNRQQQEYFIREGYTGNNDVYSVIRLLKDSFADVPIRLYDKKTGETIEEGEAYDLIVKNWRGLAQQVAIWYSLTGETYVVKESEILGGTPDKLTIYPSHLMFPRFNRTGDPFSGLKQYDYQGYSNSRVFYPDEVLHFFNIDPSDEGMAEGKGLSPLQPAKDLLNAANERNNAEAHFFKNRGASMLISSNPGKDGLGMLKAKDKEKLDEAFKSRIGGSHKANSVIHVEGSARVDKLGLSPEDLKILETKQPHLRSIANLYGVPSELLNDAANKTYNNRATAQKAVYHDAVFPVLNNFLELLENDCLNRYSQIENINYGIEIIEDEVSALMPDRAERHQEIREDFRAGIIDEETAREKLGYV